MGLCVALLLLVGVIVAGNAAVAAAASASGIMHNRVSNAGELEKVSSKNGSTLMAQRLSYCANLERHLRGNDFMRFSHPRSPVATIFTASSIAFHCHLAAFPEGPSTRTRSASCRSFFCWARDFIVETAALQEVTLQIERCTVNLHLHVEFDTGENERKKGHCIPLSRARPDQ